MCRLAMLQYSHVTVVQESKSQVTIYQDGKTTNSGRYVLYQHPPLTPPSLSLSPCLPLSTVAHTTGIRHNSHGKAVALNCGACTHTAAAFYLPLSKIVRALDLIRRGERVSRGTIQTVLKHTAFDEARRLGLSENTEAALRKEFPEETGVLVVEQVGICDNMLRT